MTAFSVVSIDRRQGTLDTSVLGSFSRAGWGLRDGAVTETLEWKAGTLPCPYRLSVLISPLPVLSAGHTPVRPPARCWDDHTRQVSQESLACGFLGHPTRLLRPRPGPGALDLQEPMEPGSGYVDRAGPADGLAWGWAGALPSSKEP